MISNEFCKKILMSSATVLLIGGTAFAQMQPGAGAPPGGQTTPGQANPGTAVGNMPPGMGQGSNAQAMDDKAFVRNALEGGMAEVQLGQLAAQKSSSPDVKQFGQKMAEDHAKLGDQMKLVANQMGVSPPAGPSKKNQKLLAKLQGLSGQEFDQEYIKAMVKDHKKDEMDFKSEAQMSQNPAVKQVAAQAEQVTAAHLQMIKQIAQAHNVKA